MVEAKKNTHFAAVSKDLKTQHVLCQMPKLSWGSRAGAVRAKGRGPSLSLQQVGHLNQCEILILHVSDMEEEGHLRLNKGGERSEFLLQLQKYRFISSHVHLCRIGLWFKMMNPNNIKWMEDQRKQNHYQNPCSQIVFFPIADDADTNNNFLSQHES